MESSESGKLGVSGLLKNQSDSDDASEDEDMSISKEPLSFSCPCCGSSFVTRLSLSRHMVYHENDPSYNCNLCPAIFFKKEQLPQHISAVHGNGEFSCATCNKSFSRKENLLKHKRNVHNSNNDGSNTIKKKRKVDEDESCSSSCGDINSIGIVEQQQQKNEPSNLPAANVPSYTSSSVSRSLASIYEKSSSSEEDEEGSDSEVDRSMLHEISTVNGGTEDVDSDLLSNYEPIHYDNEGNLVFIGSSNQGSSTVGYSTSSVDAPIMKGKLQCSQCSAAFTNHYNLDRHVESHNSTRPHRCSICPDNRGFIRKEHLTKHLSSVHSGMKFTCEYCGKDISRKDHLIRHIKNVHPAEFLGYPSGMDEMNMGLSSSGDISRGGMVISEKTLQSMQPKPKKPYLSCDMCPGTFTLLNDLLEHQRTVHSDVRKYSCDHCPKSFKRREHLQKHVVLHTGCKDYSCDTCGKDFPRKDALQDHIRRIHGPEPSTTEATLLEYKCKQCDNRFLSKSNLRRHKHIAHSNNSNTEMSTSVSTSLAPVVCLPPVPPLVRISQFGSHPFNSTSLIRNSTEQHVFPGLLFVTNNEESFSCAHCTLVFSQHNDFITHLATHRLK